MQIYIYVAIGFAIVCLIALAFAPNVFKPTPEVQRVLDVTRSVREDHRAIGDKERIQNRILNLAGSLRARFGLADNPVLKARLLAAGVTGQNSKDVYFAAQFMVPVALAVSASFIPSNTLFWVFACGLIGYLLPDMWLTGKTRGRKKRIRKSLPDALDLMVICVDAGLGIDQALIRVGAEMEVSHPDIALEFNQVNLEQRAGRPRVEAWQNLADRTQIEEFSAFVNMLAQTDRFGTPIIRALSRFSEEIRLKRRQHAEEAAAKTKIKIIFPLVLCIFPCIFIVLLAPAIISIGSGLDSMAK